MKKLTAKCLLILLVFFGSGSHSYADQADGAKSCQITTEQVAVDDGTIHYRTAGMGPPILLLHGLFAQKEQWDGILCLLSAAGYFAIAPDLPGYGQSVGFPLADYKLENQVVVLGQFMGKLGIARFDLAGSSMGGAIAALLARQHPRQVRSLAFIGSPLGVIGWGTAVREVIYEGGNPFIPIDVAQLDVELALLFVNPPAIPEAVKSSLVQEYVDHNRHYQQVWNIVNLYGTVLNELPPSSLPTLIVWGDDDKVFAVDGADRLRHRYSRAKLVKLPKAGHLPLLENAGETTAIYLRFLKNDAKAHSRQR